MDKATGKYWDKPWSLVDGCTPCSPGCDHCWSKAIGERFGRWPEEVTFRKDRMDIPWHMKRPTVFSVWNDLFHKDVSTDSIMHTLSAIENIPRHTYLVLTKRPDRMVEVIGGSLGAGLTINLEKYLPQLWFGTTVCNQSEADKKIPEILKVPGHKWLSIEPMLEKISIEEYCMGFDPYWSPEGGGDGFVKLKNSGVHWVVVGAETGPKRRPCNVEWIRSIVQQCQAAGVPVWVKAVDLGKKVSHDMNEWPEDLRIREVPWAR